MPLTSPRPTRRGCAPLQFGESLNQLLEALKTEQTKLADFHGRYVPIAVKIAPDMDEQEIELVGKALVKYGIDGVIATNTTLERTGVGSSPIAEETGGLSGAPVRQRSTDVIRSLAKVLDGALPIIGVGGVCDGAGAREKIQAGASLVQVYSGFIYRGPGLVSEAAKAAAKA